MTDQRQCAPLRQVERWLPGIGYAQKLGVNPHFSYDLEAKQWTSEVGLSYLVLQEGRPANSLPLLNANALTVGVRVGTRPKEAGGPYASVFFATVLGVK